MKDKRYNSGDWRDRWDYMKNMTMKDLYENKVTKNGLAGDRLPTMDIYREQVSYLLKFCLNVDKFNILEIGPAFGGFYKALLETNMKLKKYVMIDGKPMIKLAKEFLTKEEKQNVSFLIPDKIKTIDKHFDLIVSNNCINETSKEYQDYFFNNVIFLSDRFFGIVDSVNKDDYLRLNNHFKEVLIEDGPYHEIFERNLSCIYAEI